MRIPCPFCGDRDAHEFVYRGDAAPVRPAEAEGLLDYLYLRDNVAGPMHEYWYHSQGCRNWLELQRDTRTHEIFASALVGKAQA
ncbi:MAG: sarcosine oxidase subunit delta [Caulobacteraceae bacterium]